MPRTTAARPLLVVAAAVTIALAGCVPEPEPDPTPTPEPSALFDSEEEALAAAEDAYAAYLEMSDEIARQGWEAPESLEKWVAEPLLSQELEDASDLAEQGLRQTGESKFGELKVERYEDSQGATVLSAFVCRDLTGTDILDEEGVSVLAPDRVQRVSLRVVLETTGAAPFKVTRSETWTGDGVC